MDEYNAYSDIEIQRFLNKLEEKEKRKNMYHYTSLDTFFKILDSIKDDVFAFRAGSVYTMNDAQEIRLGYNYLKELLPIVEEELNIPQEERFCNLTNNQCQNERILANLGDWLINNDKNIFVVSFSKTPDILPMWALYGGKGHGVCLGFSTYTIKQFYNAKVRGYCHIDECRYMDDEIKEFLKCSIMRYYNIYKEAIKNDVSKINPLEKAKYLSILSCITGTYIKHYGFEYEKEIRACFLKDKKEWKFYETSYHNRAAYVEVPIPINALTSIIVGPAVNMDNVRNSILLCLRSKGIHIKPVQSTIPYRQF